MNKHYNLKSPAFILSMLSLLLAFVVLLEIQKASPLPNKGNDIYHIWSDGYEIAHGINPYSKIHGSDMLKNNKYSTYLPGFFLMVSAYVSIGFETFQEWLKFWRPASYVLHCLMGILIFFVVLSKTGYLLALFSAHFWLLSRWPISVMNSGQIDILAMLMLIISLLTLKSRPKLALIVFGLSLSIKQIGVFMLPIIILLSYRFEQSFLLNIKRACSDLFYISIIPVLVCLPFLVWDSTGLIKSILFSATRSPGGHLKIPSIDELLDIVGLAAKIPMLALMSLIYLLVMFKKISAFTAGLSIYLVFISFNSILFKQYIPWFCPFLGLALTELIKKTEDNIKA